MGVEKSRHQAHRRLARLLRQPEPVRLLGRRTEQIQLIGFGRMTSVRAVLASHRHLSDSLGKTLPLLQEPAHSMTGAPPPPVTSSVRPARRDRPVANPPSAPASRPRSRTSTLETPASGRSSRRPDCSGNIRFRPCQTPHGLGRSARTRDATDKEPSAQRSHGRCFVALYNEVRPHLSLQKDAPMPRDAHKLGRVRSMPILGDSIINMFEFRFPTGTMGDQVRDGVQFCATVRPISPLWTCHMHCLEDFITNTFGFRFSVQTRINSG